MKFDELVEKRHSVRKFSRKKPSWKDISLAINAARLAPLAGNTPNLKFVVVSDEKIISQLADAANQDWIKQAFYVLVACSEDEKLVLSYGERGKMYARQQTGAALENLWLKLEELGLATCWVGAFYETDIKSALRLPENIQVEAMFPIGFSAEKTKQKPKPELSSIVFWEKWGNLYLIPPKKQEV
jgi:nitroreductase